MTVLIANVATGTDSFGGWVTKTNLIATTITNKAVTVNSNAANGNAHVNGLLSANALFANSTFAIGKSSSNVTFSNTTLVIQTSGTANAVITASGMVIGGVVSYTSSLMKLGNTQIQSGNIISNVATFTNTVTVGNTLITRSSIYSDYANTKYFYASNNSTVGDLEANVYSDRWGLQIYDNPTGFLVQNSKMTATDLWIKNIHTGAIEADTITLKTGFTGNVSIVGDLNVFGNSHFIGQNNYFDHGLTSNGAINMIAPPAANSIMILRSDNYAGIHIIGDKQNTAGEPGGAFVTFSVDGLDPETSQTHSGMIGITQDAVDDVYNDTPNKITDSLPNAVVVGNRVIGKATQIVSNNKAMITLLSNENVGLGTNAPQDRLDLKNGAIRIGGSTSGYVRLQANAAAGGTTFTLPATPGVLNQVIGTDGSGVMSWINQWTPSINQDLVCRSLGVGVSAPGAGGVGQIRAINNITSYYSSDETLKTNVRPIPDALDKVMSINGVQFDWTEDYIESEGGEDGFFIRKHDVGVIAQEIEKVLPEVVIERDDGIKAVKYDRIVALLIEAVKELKEEVDSLKNCQCGKCQ
ncbi:Intramolecular chaperone auto-processing domain containing protein [uncultured Caudovirales phage]|uniref:Intramolecular chaperone auto-processing domain containing protein n=1 Tax=uncultured Caudovirales phage TaxID=2100421 RepID=A0A6J7WT62_9CAUD|nr:Intramolecular chaperone auto-processing domain containing protein [uncultured Caudovirales phage]